MIEDVSTLLQGCSSKTGQTVVGKKLVDCYYLTTGQKFLQRHNLSSCDMEMEEIIKSLRSEFSNELARQLAAQRKDFETKLGEQKKIQNDLVKGLEDKLGEQKAKLAQQNKAHNVQMAASKKAHDDQMAALNAQIATDQTISPTGPWTVWNFPTSVWYALGWHLLACLILISSCVVLFAASIHSRTERVLSWLIAAVLVHITQADKIKKPLGIKMVEWTPVVVGLVALIYYAVGSFVYFVRQLYLKKLAFTLKIRTVTASLNPSTQSQNLPTTTIGAAHRHQSAAGGAAGLHSSPIRQSPNLATGGETRLRGSPSVTTSSPDDTQKEGKARR